MPGGRGERTAKAYAERLAIVSDSTTHKRRRRANTVLNNEIVGTLNRLHDILGETNERN